MFNVFLFIVFLILGIGLGIIYNKFIIKEYPDYKRKFAYFITVIVFHLFSLSIYVLVVINISVKKTIRTYSVKMEQYILNNYPDNEFVQNGLDLKGINNDITQINTTVSELKSLLPTHTEIGVNKFIYDLIVDYAIKELQECLNVVKYSAKMINNFSDKNNVLTVSSVTNGLRINVVKLLNTILFIIAIIFFIAFSIYIINSLLIVKREKKFKRI
jgi:hypothetical protein